VHGAQHLAEIGGSPQASPDAATLEAEIADLIKTAGASLRGEPADTALDPGGPERERAAWDADIRILATDKIVGLAPFSAVRTRRTAIVAGALALTLVLGGIGGWTARSLIGGAASPAAVDQRPPAQMPPSDGRTIAIETARAVEPTRPTKPGGATGGRIDGSTTTGSAARLDGAPGYTKAKAAPAAQPSPSSALASAPAPRRPKTPAPPLTPFPETKPTTIEGWVVREVTNGTAVLQGPNGVWNAKRGDNVPGLGTVDSIVMWGNRWIVSTSRGLVSTQ
jgi:hypothetical protein